MPIQKLTLFMKEVISIFSALLFIAIITLTSCSEGENKSGDFDKSFYRVDKVHITKSYKDCKPESENCTYVMFDYPVFKNAGKSKVLKKLNAEVIRQILAGTDESDPEKAATGMIEAYKKFVTDSEFDEDEASWFDKRKAEWLHIDKRALSLKVSVRNYYGGAHTNGFVSLRNYIPTTGDSLGLGMVFSPENLKKLTIKGEEIFRKTQKIPDNMGLEEAGYWFEGNRFYLTGNFAFTGKGLLFYYNEYEIAPFSMGPVKITIPYSQVENLLTPIATPVAEKR